ncbi:MFS transporter [Clostridium oceanicum]|uniref:MFS transporter n=1 Tax=Clostridium oceanicum TaxID=1543 RepID=A0ABN1JB89_9CLOT
MSNLQKEKIKDDEIILGKDRSNFQRYLAFFAIIVVYFFYCYNFMVGTFVKPVMTYSLSDGGFAFTLKQTEEIFAVMSLATIPGTILFGIISSKIGKKFTLIIVALTIGITTFLPLTIPTSYLLWKVSRFTTGIALGGVFGTAVPLVTEMFPQRYRGKLAAILTSQFSIAMIFGGQLYGALGDANWKLLMYTAVIPPIVGAILVYLFVPSDREHTKKLIKGAKNKGEKINYLNMYKGKYLWIGIGAILLSGANFTAYSSFSNNATTYLKTTLGLSASVAGAVFSLQGIGQLVGYNLWGFVADKFGRKVPAVGMLLSAAGVFIYMKLGANDITTFKMVSLFLGFSMGFSGAWGAYYTELFPEKFSSLSSGISFNGGRIISTFTLPAIAGIAATSAGMTGIFKISMFVFIAGTVVWILLPETLNKPRKD